MHTLTHMHSASSSRWSAYVKGLVGNDTQATVARRSGINQTTISRWLSGREPQPSAPNVVALARAYGVSPVEALVVAGLITSDEANGAVA